MCKECGKLNRNSYEKCAWCKGDDRGERPPLDFAVLSYEDADDAEIPVPVIRRPNAGIFAATIFKPFTSVKQQNIYAEIVQEYHDSKMRVEISYAMKTRVVPWILAIKYLSKYFNSFTKADTYKVSDVELRQLLIETKAAKTAAPKIDYYHKKFETERNWITQQDFVALCILLEEIAKNCSYEVNLRELLTSERERALINQDYIDTFINLFAHLPSRRIVLNVKNPKSGHSIRLPVLTSMKVYEFRQNVYEQRDNLNIAAKHSGNIILEICPDEIEDDAIIVERPRTVIYLNDIAQLENYKLKNGATVYASSPYNNINLIIQNMTGDVINVNVPTFMPVSELKQIIYNKRVELNITPKNVSEILLAIYPNDPLNTTGQQLEPIFLDDKTTLENYDLQNGSTVYNIIKFE